MRAAVLIGLIPLGLILFGCDTDTETLKSPDVGPPAYEPPPDCDPLDPAFCAMPWPSDLYLRPDESRTTGYTLTFGATTLPANIQGIHVDPTPYQRMDGYGLGVPLMTVFPNLDAANLPGEWDIASSMASDAPIVWLAQTDDGFQRIPYWAELDLREVDGAIRTLFVRPAVILKPNTRYVVGFRDLLDLEGNPIAPSAAFAALRDDTNTPTPASRKDRFTQIFADLEAANMPRESLILAWDFHTASSDALHGPLLHMRDDALSTVGESGPELTIESITEFTPEDNPHIAIEIEGTFHVPHYLSSSEYLDTTGWSFPGKPGELPSQTGWRDPTFWIRIPHGALDGTPHGLVQYGHGLLGSGTQVRGSFNGQIATDHQLIFYACDMIGMAEEDEAAVGVLLTEMSWFPWLADRMHQGMIEHILLARAMRERLPSLPAITDRNIVIDPNQSFYSGISQGGIYGATLMAISPDFTYGHLGVPGQNYSTLLSRSVDFDPFFLVLEGLYPAHGDQALILSTIQQLWNGTDPVSYYRHITAEPFAGNDPHYILAAPAKGDYQVSPLTIEIAARSGIGITLMANYDDERTVDLVPPQPYPHQGSGVVSWHFGNPWPTDRANRPPEEDEWGDPHGKPRRIKAHQTQMVHFFRTGEIIDVCDDMICAP